MTSKITAINIRPGDIVGGKKVLWAIPNYLRDGKTEVRFDDGSTEFYRNDKLVNQELRS